eukprot:SAG22_NODE_1397_length_4507_cov_56.156534_1_plen_89_part_00
MNDYFHGLQFADNKDYATMVSSNYKMCYDLVPSALLDDEDQFEPNDKTGGIHMDTLEHMSIHPGAVTVLSNATSVVSQNYLNDYLVFY